MNQLVLLVDEEREYALTTQLLVPTATFFFLWLLIIKI
jgi:hypothetical protein